MISYETSHYNLEKIRSANEKMNRCWLKREYRIYGLMAEYNNHVHIQLPATGAIDTLRYWLHDHGMVCRYEASDDGDDVVRIGLRRDVRRDPAFAAALVKTFVAVLEGKFRGNLRSFKMPQRKFMRKKEDA